MFQGYLCPHCKQNTGLMGMHSYTKCPRCGNVLVNPGRGEQSEAVRTSYRTQAESVSVRPIERVPDMGNDYIRDWLEGQLTNVGDHLWIVYSRKFYEVEITETSPGGIVMVSKGTKITGGAFDQTLRSTENYRVRTNRS